jgi:hypothetical protein
MKAELKSNGYIHIVAETIAEAFALEYLSPIKDEPCEKCGQKKVLIMFNCDILNDYNPEEAI